MIVERFYEEKLAQASYLVGCGKTGEAIVIDPNRNIGAYLKKAAEKGLRIVAVTETHIHADYVSGNRELAHVAGATLYLSDEGTADWKYAFANEANVKLVKDGDDITIGNLRLDVVKTPGHTPEHITFVLTDTPASREPYCAFTGDFIFAGDVGRPDLLERAAGIEGTMAEGARTLFDSLKRFRRYDDGLVLWPGHGAGSACGKSLGGTPSTSLGYERKSNWGLQITDPDVFIEAVLEGQPDPPPYFKEMKRINKLGPALVHENSAPERISPENLERLLDAGNLVLDVRASSRSATSLIRGAINIPLDASFVTWAGWMVPYDEAIYLIADSESEVLNASTDLALIGIDHVSGWIDADTLDISRTLVVPQVTSMELLQAQSNNSIVVDVRSASEYREGHIPGAVNIPLGRLAERQHELPKHKRIIVQCRTGGRSAVAASVLQNLGFENIANYPHGFVEYASLGLPIQTGSTTIEPALTK